MTKKICRYLAVIGVSLIVGCGSEEETQNGEAVENTAQAPRPEEYMRDQNFRKKLDDQEIKRNKLLSDRYRVQRALQKKARAMEEKMPGAQESAIVAALEKDPEWVSLKKRMEDLVMAADENRAKTLDVVRDRLAPTQNKISQ